jgi:hypothetical protein
MILLSVAAAIALMTQGRLSQHCAHAPKSHTQKKRHRVPVSKQMALNTSSRSIETKAHNFGDLWTFKTLGNDSPFSIERIILNYLEKYISQISPSAYVVPTNFNV